jgi:YHS domain-containing protein/thiol-disulfide isomerase/thioredoxin
MSYSGIKLGVSVYLSGIWILVATASGGVWRTDYEQARIDAQRQQIPLLIHFHAEWCSPCRRMDREVLNTPQLTRLLGRKVIAVKVDSDHNPRLVKKFAIRVLPSDVIVDHRGRLLQQNTGYLSPAVYLARLTRQLGPDTEQPAVATSRRNNAERTPDATERSAPASRRGNPPRATTAVGNLAPLEQVPIQRPEPMIGLDSYSPVSLWKSRKWRKGTAEFQVEFQQVTYYLVNAEERRLFQSDPRKFAPRLTGCDPVIMTETDQAISGNTQFGAFFDSGLYLFASRASREQFKKSPLRYTRIQHALRRDRQPGSVRR